MAVHGLHGHPRKSWTSDELGQDQTMWLEDLLPRHIPSARVMVFGYKAVTTGEENILSTTGLEDASQALLDKFSEKDEGAFKVINQKQVARCIN